VHAFVIQRISPVLTLNKIVCSSLVVVDPIPGEIPPSGPSKRMWIASVLLYLLPLNILVYPRKKIELYLRMKTYAGSRVPDTKKIYVETEYGGYIYLPVIIN